MSQKIDCLRSQASFEASFVVNTAVDYVSIAHPALGPMQYLEGTMIQASTGYYMFYAADKIEYLSVSILLPFGFEQYKISTEDAPAVSFHIVDGVGQKFSTKTPYVYVPNTNYELTLPGVIQDDIVNSGNFQINMVVNNLKISMIGVPESLNGKTIGVTTWCKIRHNLAMKVYP